MNSGSGAAPSLAGKTLVMAIGLTGRAGLQGLTLILLARALGAHELGLFVAVLSVCTIAAPLAGVGSWAILVRDTARDHAAYGPALANALLAMGASGLVLLPAVSLLCRNLMPPEFPLAALVAVAFAEVLLVPIVELCGRAYQAFDRSVAQVLVVTLPTALRFAALVALLVGSDIGDAASWSYVHSACAAAAALTSALVTYISFGGPHWRRVGLRGFVKDGFPFALSGAVNRTQAEAEKPLLATLSLPATAGTFTVAGRLVDFVSIPIGAFIEASLASFFRAGARGTAPTFALARRVGLAATGYSIAAGLLIVGGAGLLPHLLGASFDESVPIVRGLAAMPLLTAIYLILAAIPAAQGRQHEAVLALLAGAAMKFALSALLIPVHGAGGAIVASYASIVTMIVFLGIVNGRSLGAGRGSPPAP